MTPDLPPALPAIQTRVSRRAGPLAYYVAGSGNPVLLVHSINAAASAYEMRPIFERLKAQHRVYALDLPGYGFSDRSDRDYSLRLFTDALGDLLDAIGTDCPNLPVDVVALSLSAEFAARAALEWPGRVRTLTLITPTGFSRGSHRLHGPDGASREVPVMYRLLRWRGWSQRLYEALTSRASVRYFLQRTWGSKQIDEGAFEYAWLTAHQPGARFAPLAFLSRRLFAADIRTVLERLRLPVWLAHGTRGDFKDFSEADWTRERPNWRVTAYPTGALVQFESAEFLDQLYAFLRQAPA